MSQRALLLATRDTIKAYAFTGLPPLAQLQCEVQFDGEPPPSCGMFFIAVHPGEWRNQNGDAGTNLDEVYGVDVTVTVRATVQPLDRLGPNLLAGAGGQCLDVLLEQLRALLHGNYGVLNKANAGQAYSIGAGAAGFVETIFLQGCDPPQARGPEWFSTVSDTEQRTNPPVGLSQTLHFGSANRVQDIVSQT